MLKVTFGTTSVLAAVLFVAAPSVAMAQDVSVTPTDTSVQKGPSPQGSYPVEVYARDGKHFAGVNAGNGAAGGAVGTISNGQIHDVEFGTKAPAELRTLVPGTDIPEDRSR